jgi:SAM-dependent methyltransferase
MNAYDWIKQRDRNAADASAGTEAYFSLSPTRWSLYRVLRGLLPQTLHGRCLDAGAGRMAFALMARDCVEQYIALDVQARPGLDAAGSALDLPLRDECLDSILCLQVLEHVPDPERALREFYRCLKPGGVLLLSVPHLAYLHNEPHDYFRFTHYGLRAILSRAGFQDIEIVPAGGLLSFLGHIPRWLLKPSSPLSPHPQTASPSPSTPLFQNPIRPRRKGRKKKTLRPQLRSACKKKERITKS